MTIFYFSATGNNLYVAKSLGGKTYSIPQLLKETKRTFSDDKIGLVLPVYYFTVPPYIQDFLNQVTLKTPYLFAILTYGMFSGTAATWLQNWAKRKGQAFAYLNHIQMVDNYLPGFDMQKQMDTEPHKHIEDKIAAVKADLDQNVHFVRQDSPFMHLFGRLIAPASSPKNDQVSSRYQEGFEHRFTVDEHCVGCGICAKVCPASNIQMQENRPHYTDHCVACLACTQNCPHQAIRMKGEKNDVRFRNQHVSLADLIDANNQAAPGHKPKVAE
ncbi:MAG TPA: 4Fe-4S ferredoxin [Ruminococcaceae bacterium]|nr:4Fe-4S ferredoxin [Oscillospiraceae bacterium]